LPDDVHASNSKVLTDGHLQQEQRYSTSEHGNEVRDEKCTCKKQIEIPSFGCNVLTQCVLILAQKILAQKIKEMHQQEKNRALSQKTGHLFPTQDESTGMRERKKREWNFPLASYVLQVYKSSPTNVWEFKVTNVISLRL